MDRVSPEARSRIMRAIRSRWTRQERLFAASAPKGWERGTAEEANADFVYRPSRVAVFLDGDFWHARHLSPSLPDRWREKLSRNAERDAERRSTLEARGWAVLSYWESDFMADPHGCIAEVQDWVHRRARDNEQDD